MTDTHLSMACFAASGLAFAVALAARPRPRKPLRLRNDAVRGLPCTTHIIARHVDGRVRLTEHRTERPPHN